MASSSNMEKSSMMMMMEQYNRGKRLLTLIAVLITTMVGSSQAFVGPQYHHQHHHSQWLFALRRRRCPLYMSSIGGDDDNGNNRPPGGNGPLDDFLDPLKRESENLKRAREALSEGSLPISYDMKTGDDDNNKANSSDLSSSTSSSSSSTDSAASDENEEQTQDTKDPTETPGKSSSSSLPPFSAEKAGKLVGPFASPEETNALLQSNPYLNVVAKLSPSDLIRKFTASAHPRVQDAVRSTILGLIGNLPKMAFETTTVTTGERLASLMFQLQMTGYMFKNAEYRLSMSQSLGIDVTSNYKPLNGNAKYLLPKSHYLDADDDEDIPLSFGKVTGKIKVSYGSSDDDDDDDEDDEEADKIDDADDIATSNVANKEDTTNKDAVDDIPASDTEIEEAPKLEKKSKKSKSSKLEVEVDAEAYMSELREQVQNLRDELNEKRMAKEEAIRKDLLLYIRTLPKQQLDSLTNTMSQDVLKAMKGLVNVVMAGIGEGKIGPDTITEQTGEAMAQLCMWQLVVGYNLRELEVREEMKTALLSGKVETTGTSTATTDDNNENDNGDKDASVDYNAGGFE